MTGRNLKQELEQLDIISFDCTGVTTKEDILLSLDKIKEHIQNNSDEMLLKKIDTLRKNKKARRYRGIQPE